MPFLKQQRRTTNKQGILRALVHKTQTRAHTHTHPRRTVYTRTRCEWRVGQEGRKTREQGQHTLLSWAAVGDPSLVCLSTASPLLMAPRNVTLKLNQNTAVYFLKHTRQETRRRKQVLLLKCLRRHLGLWNASAQGHRRRQALGKRCRKRETRGGPWEREG